MADEIYEVPSAPTRGSGFRRRVGVWIAVLAAVGGGAFAIQVSTDAGGEVAREESDLAGRYNGLESVGLPVSVEPATGLIDQQSVTVTASGFTPGRQVALVQCWSRQGGTASADDCDGGNYSLAAADGQGNVQASYTVRRHISTGSGRHDCAISDAEQSCRVAVADISDYDESGSAATSFDPSVAGLAAPEITVSPASGLRDGDLVTVSATDMAPGDTARITQCVMNTTGIPGCFSTNPTTQTIVDDNGTFVASLEVRRMVEGLDGPIDCVTDPYGCRVVVQGATTPNPVRLEFDGSIRPPSDPTYTLTPSSGLVDGSVVVVGLGDLRDGATTALIRQCVDIAGGASCRDLGTEPLAGDSLSASVSVVRMLDAGDGTTRDCAEPGRRCYLQVETEVQTVERLPLSFQEVD